MLILLQNYSLTKKQDSKKDAIVSIGSNNFEVIFILFIKIVIIKYKFL